MCNRVELFSKKKLLKIICDKDWLCLKLTLKCYERTIEYTTFIDESIIGDQDIC